jgi:type VI secretion system protein ImpF
LLNTKVAKSDIPDQVKKSVLNYGINCCIGLIPSRKTTDDIIVNIRESLVNFEPRFLPESIKVEIVEFDKPQSIRNVVLEITAHLNLLDTIEFMRFKTKIDVDTGHYYIERKANE